MAMNPDTNTFEPVHEMTEEEAKRFESMSKTMEAMTGLLRPDGTPVPKTWSTFKVGELVVIKNYTFRVEYVGETSILFEPVGAAEVLVAPLPTL